MSSATPPDARVGPAPAVHRTALGKTPYRVDVYALYYNWLQIKDGRARLSFA